MVSILLIGGPESHSLKEALQHSELFSQVLEARDGLEAQRVLHDDPVDIVLCDLEVLGTSGERLLQARDAGAGRGETSFVFLTASENVSRTLSRIDQETCDVVSKSFDPAELIARLRLQTKIKQLNEEVRERSRRLEKESTLDPLTGLRSRSFIREVLRTEILRAQRHHIPLSILMGDLDHLRGLNERWGRSAGDAALQGVADFLRRNLRSTDSPGRFGDEEFLVVLPHTPIAGAQAVAEFWRKAVAKTPLQVAGGEVIEMTVSIGVADLRPPMKTREELVKAAEEALSAAKAKGRNSVVVAGS